MAKAHSKTEVAITAFRHDAKIAEIIKRFDVRANQIVEWKKQLVERAASGTGPVTVTGGDEDVALARAHAKISRLSPENVL